MKSTVKILAVILSIILIHSCKKEKVPSLTTNEVTNITGTSALSGGNITDEGSGSITARGICWSTTNKPTISNIKTTDGDGVGSFVSNLSGLNGATTYYVRAYATNNAGVGYGMVLSFKTLGQAPTATTKAATNITATSAALNGTINANYFSTDNSFEYGTTTSYGQIISASPSPLTDNLNTDITSDITGLEAGTTYHFRVKAVNSLGTTYGEDLTFTTIGGAPTDSTQPASNIQGDLATLNGIVNANYVPTSVSFEYGTTSSYGTVVNITQGVTGNYPYNVNVVITNLAVSTTYHFRIIATNASGTTKGTDLTFTTKSGEAPLVVTLAATNTTPSGAHLNGTVLPNNLSTTVTFEFGTTTVYGNTVSATQSPVSGNTSVQVSADVSNLILGTTYHFRIVATNAAGTSFGNDMTFIAVYTIGENMFGGFIFYIDATGEHGLVAAPSDQTHGNTGVIWSDCTFAGAKGKAVGIGYQNTLDIVLGCSTAGIAAKLCYDLDLNGYTDWFLPSLGELDLLQGLYDSKIGDLTGYDYWSSTQDNLGFAWGRNFYADWEVQTSKNNLNRVRAIRNF